MSIEEFMKAEGIKSKRQLGIQLGYPPNQAGQAVNQALKSKTAPSSFMLNFMRVFGTSISYNFDDCEMEVGESFSKYEQSDQLDMGGIDVLTFTRKSLLMEGDTISQNPAVYSFLAATGVEKFHVWHDPEDDCISFSEINDSIILGKFPSESLPGMKEWIEGIVNSPDDLFT